MVTTRHTHRCRCRRLQQLTPVAAPGFRPEFAASLEGPGRPLSATPRSVGLGVVALSAASGQGFTSTGRLWPGTATGSPTRRAPRRALAQSPPIGRMGKATDPILRRRAEQVVDLVFIYDVRSSSLRVAGQSAGSAHRPASRRPCRHHLTLARTTRASSWDQRVPTWSARFSCPRAR